MPDADKWHQRVMFLINPDGDAVGTITAWNDDYLVGTDMGLTHWLAIIPQMRGKGLAKPLLSVCINRLQELGYTRTYLETGSARIPAINLYLHFGFVPFLKDKQDMTAWRTIAPHLKYPVDI